MKDKVKKIISNKKVIVTIYVLFALIASLQLLSGKKTYNDGGPEYNKYNNYTIFEKSFQHLKNNQDLYVLYEKEHWDLYKYTPTFSVFFGAFSVMPDWLGLSLWNLMNALALLLGVYLLPRLSNYQKGLVLLIVLLELLTSMQNAQSNGLIAGLLVFAFALLEKNKYFSAAISIVFLGFIKLFGIVGFALFLCYPKKGKLAIYTIISAAILFVLPLIFVSFGQYMALFKSYLGMLSSDHDASLGYSVMGWLQSWFAINVDKIFIVGVGVTLFLLPFYRFKMWKEYTFKYLLLTSILIWIVIFNHKAESPTFIIAMTGVALWFINSEKTAVNISLFIFAFVFTSLSPTDLFPRFLREDFVKPYVLKAVPCIFIWFKIIYDMMTFKSQEIAEVKVIS